MWAVAKVFREGDRLYYTGIKNDWSNQSDCAACWVDRRDAWRCITANDLVGKAETVYLEGGRKPDPDQWVWDETLATASRSFVKTSSGFLVHQDPRREDCCEFHRNGGLLDAKCR